MDVGDQSRQSKGILHQGILHNNASMHDKTLHDCNAEMCNHYAACMWLHWHNDANNEACKVVTSTVVLLQHQVPVPHIMQQPDLQSDPTLHVLLPRRTVFPETDLGSKLYSCFLETPTAFPVLPSIESMSR